MNPSSAPAAPVARPTTPQHRGRAASEVGAVGLLWAALLVVMFVTYWRIDPAELYHVSHPGVVGGLSRVLVELNFPIAFVGLAVVLLAADRLGRSAAMVAVPAGLLCAVVAYPGVVDEGNLDARWVNVLPALGVAAAVALHVAAVRRHGTGWTPARSGDRVRLVLAAVVVVLALPYLAAEAGWYLPDVVFVTGRQITGADGVVHAAVHHGHHHGLDGAMLVLSALLLSRPLPARPRLGAATGGFLGLMFAYGAMLFVQDSWNEQVVGRGTTGRTLPSPLVPGLRPIWAVIAVLAVVAALVLRAEAARDRGRAGGQARG